VQVQLGANLRGDEAVSEEGCGGGGGVGGGWAEEKAECGQNKRGMIVQRTKKSRVMKRLRLIN
jgi:hypothetical protein